MDPTKLSEKTRVKMEQALKCMKRDSIVSETSNNNSRYQPAVDDVYHTIGIPARQMLALNQEKRLSVPFIYSTKDKFTTNKRVSESNTEVNRPMYRDDIFFNASLARVPQYTSHTSLGYNLAVTKLPSKNDIDEERKKTCKLCPEAVRRALLAMLDFGLLKSPSFIILAIGGFFTMMGFYVPFMYIVDRASELGGMDKTLAIWLVSSIGIANTIGRVLCGVLSSFPGVNALLVTNVALTLGGIATAFSGFFLNTEAQFFYSIIFGLSICELFNCQPIKIYNELNLDFFSSLFRVTPFDYRCRPFGIRKIDERIRFIATVSRCCSHNWCPIGSCFYESNRHV